MGVVQCCAVAYTGWLCCVQRQGQWCADGENTLRFANVKCLWGWDIWLRLYVALSMSGSCSTSAVVAACFAAYRSTTSAAAASAVATVIVGVSGSVAASALTTVCVTVTTETATSRSSARAVAFHHKCLRHYCYCCSSAQYSSRLVAVLLALLWLREGHGTACGPPTTSMEARGHINIFFSTFLP